MGSDRARGKAEAMRWLRNRLMTEALLEGLHGRDDDRVVELRSRRKAAPKSADQTPVRLSS